MDEIAFTVYDRHFILLGTVWAVSRQQALNKAIAKFRARERHPMVEPRHNRFARTPHVFRNDARPLGASTEPTSLQ